MGHGLLCFLLYNLVIFLRDRLLRLNLDKLVIFTVIYLKYKIRNLVFCLLIKDSNSTFPFFFTVVTLYLTNVLPRGIHMYICAYKHNSKHTLEKFKQQPLSP